MSAENKTWLSLRDVAEEVGVHPLTVTRAIKAGRLKATRIGRLYRIRRDWMEAWICPPRS